MTGMRACIWIVRRDNKGGSRIPHGIVLPGIYTGMHYIHTLEVLNIIRIPVYRYSYYLYDRTGTIPAAAAAAAVRCTTGTIVEEGCIICMKLKIIYIKTLIYKDPKVPV